VRDAFEHIKASESFVPQVYFNPETVWSDNPGNHWLPYKDAGLANWDIQPTDLLFFAGHDWKILPPEVAAAPPVPIINITQPRHTRPEDPRHTFLQYPAIRIAKSSLGKKILEDFGVNGPVYLIPDAIDFSQLPPPPTSPDLDVLIVGLKNPDLATRLYKKLQWKNRWQRKNWKIAVQLPPKLPTRADFLALVNRAKIVVFLPLDAERGAEGFYLPALEAMAMSKLVICPFAVGNIDFCIPDNTCLQPEYNERALRKAVVSALGMDSAAQQQLIQAGKVIAANHDIKLEKERLLKLLEDADKIWQDVSLFKTR
jgi:glycosyltransferase involved in cell wall biosynthesis